MKNFLPVTAWLALVGIAGPEFWNDRWECLLVLFAAFVLVPKGLRLMAVALPDGYWLGVAGLAAAYFLDDPFATGISDALALPYLLLAAWITIRETIDLIAQKSRQLIDFVRIAALAYWTTGAFWAICYLANVQPLGFDPVIVSLTAAHFHLAGFTLTAIVFCLLRDDNTSTNRLLAFGALAGMPLVAAGITLTKLGGPTWVEALSGVVFAVTALAVAAQHFRLFFSENSNEAARWFWLMGALCLIAGALLATGYALRFYWPMQWFNIPNMKVWHGTLNTIGFGWLVLTGWQTKELYIAQQPAY